jgi:ABC-type proline/glycine betaine transport system ATPase subunit
MPLNLIAVIRRLRRDKQQVKSEVRRLIRLYDVTKTYENGVTALSDVTVRIHKGEFVFLVGPSGAGKSTFTKLLYREVVPTKGQVVVDGKNLVRMRAKEVPYLRRRIGMIFQDFRLLPQKTVFENVAFALEVIGASRKEIRRSVPLALSMVGLADKTDVFPNHPFRRRTTKSCDCTGYREQPFFNYCRRAHWQPGSGYIKRSDEAADGY